MRPALKPWPAGVSSGRATTAPETMALAAPAPKRSGDGGLAHLRRWQGEILRK